MKKTLSTLTLFLFVTGTQPAVFAAQGSQPAVSAALKNTITSSMIDPPWPDPDCPNPPGKPCTGTGQ
jgi:hypothetical protein